MLRSQVQVLVTAKPSPEVVVKATILVLAFLFSSSLFPFSFSEPTTGMCLEIPDNYSPCEQSTYVSSCPYWYAFADGKGNILSIEIEEYEEERTLSEYF